LRSALARADQLARVQRQNAAQNLTVSGLGPNVSK